MHLILFNWFSIFMILISLNNTTPTRINNDLDVLLLNFINNYTSFLFD